MKVSLKEEAMSNVDVKSIDQLLHPNFDEKALKQATEISKIGLPASPGLLQDKLYFQLKMLRHKLMQVRKLS